jgi:hypothetical protein
MIVSPMRVVLLMVINMTCLFLSLEVYIVYMYYIVHWYVMDSEYFCSLQQFYINWQLYCAVVICIEHSPSEADNLSDEQINSQPLTES